jgi:hypothetical protein
MRNGVPSTGSARAGCDADHSPPSSVEVVNEDLYFLSPQAPPWRVAGLLYFTIFKVVLQTMQKNLNETESRS